MSRVSIVIPGRNCVKTLDACLEAIDVIRTAPGSEVHEVIFVDDGSTDHSRAVAERHGVTVIAGEGRGAGAARNLGWRAAGGDLVWFMDSDCVADPEALAHLLPHLEDPDVAAVGGSYGNANVHSLVASLIHEEIIQRHMAMGTEAMHLATFNVIYCRSVLERLDGFDERYLKAQDAELSFRACDTGHRLHFEPRSKVLHYHAERLGPYLRTQRQQGYWRIWLHMEHPDWASSTSYNNPLDKVHPLLAMLLLASLPLLAIPYARWTPLVLLVLLLAAQWPMTAQIVARMRRPQYVLFAVLSAVRAVWRGVGMTHGTLAYLLRARSTSGGASLSP